MASPPRPLPGEIESVAEAELIACLSGDDAFSQSQSFREQCFHACRILRMNHIPPVPFAVIGRLLQVDKGTVRNHWQTFKAQENLIRQQGRPSLLTQEELDETVAIIIDAHYERRPLSGPEIRDLIHRKFGKSLRLDTLYQLLKRDGRVKSCAGTPMEDSRLHVTEQAIRDYFATLCANVSGAPAHFVFNMDEMGHQTWADAREIICFVPGDYPDETVPYPVSRTGKRVTLVACIAADGSFIRPSIVISRKTFDDELLLYGFTPEKVEIYDQSNGYIDLEIFNDWMRDTFVPELLARRERYQYQGPVFLIMDNCPTHHGHIFAELCQNHGIVPIWLPPHASNQLQMLDLCIFGLTKRAIMRANRLEKVNIQTDHIVRVLESFMSAAVPHNIIKSFANGGISLILDGDRVIRCQITPHTTRCLLGSPFDLELPPGTSDDQDDPDIEVYLQRFEGLLFNADDGVVQAREPGEDAAGAA
jgi:hypothetical protein